MEDISKVAAGVGLQKDSEFADAFNYLMIKLCEVGILRRIELQWLGHKLRNEEFGMAEPLELGFANVLFPFALLALGLVSAIGIACLEYYMGKVQQKSSGGANYESEAQKKLLSVSLRPYFIKRFLYFSSVLIHKFHSANILDYLYNW